MSSNFEWQHHQIIEERKTHHQAAVEHRQARTSHRRRAIALSVGKFVILVVLYFAISALGL